MLSYNYKLLDKLDLTKSNQYKTRMSVALEPKNQHWGQWLVARSRFVGFMRQKDLAAAVGCSEEHLSRWIKLKTPPKRITKGLDISLARALKTTKQNLFVDYFKIKPEDATVIRGFPGDNSPWKHEDWWARPIRERIQYLLFWLTDEDLQKLQEFAITLGTARERDRMYQFEQRIIQNPTILDDPNLAPLPEHLENVLRSHIQATHPKKGKRKQ